MTKFLKQHAGALLLSVLLHLALIGMLGVTLSFSKPRPAVQRLAIEAVVVESSKPLTRPRPVNQPQQQQQQEEANARREREVAAQQELVAKREAAEAEKAEAETKRKAEAETKRKAEAETKRKAEAETKRKAEADAKRKAEADAKRKAEADAKRKAEAETKRKAEADAKRKAEADAKRKADERQQREEAEFRAAIEEEESLLALQQSDAMNQYQWQIQQRIEQSWIRPPSAQVGLSCELKLIQTPSGEVIDASVGRCNGDDVVIRSLEAAVLRASPLPEPPDRRLYSRNLTILFEPEQ